MTEPQQTLPPDPLAVAGALPGGHPRVLLCGAMGSGKSTLAAGLARVRGGVVYGIGADPGSPAFGVPGAVNLGEWRHDGWRQLDAVPLCTLDAARFRLPLVRAVETLARRVNEHMLIVDAPGVVRGVAAAELLQGLAAAAAVDVVVVLAGDEVARLQGDLAALGVPVLYVAPAPLARRPARPDRDRWRTALWDRHLGDAVRQDLPFATLRVTGTPPPAAVPDAWRGRQVALVCDGEARALGEVLAFDGTSVTVALPGEPPACDTLLIRDAQRNAAGLLVTAPSVAPAAPVPGIGPARRNRAPVALSVGGVAVRLVNGTFGDPLVALEVANVHGRVLFDLGDAAALPVKALHGVGDVFVSHGHIDHIGGFLTLLRARLSGNPPPCRLYGPPGICDHIAGFLAGVRWDRIGEGGPVFLVAEVDGDTLCWSRLQAGRPPEPVASEPLVDGVLLRHEAFRVRCATLDHGIPVLAFLLQLADTLHVREEALAQLRLPPGPWLGELKHRIARGEADGPVTLPDGSRRRAGALGDVLLRVVPGTRVAYATDLADTAANRRTLVELARDADLLICEAAFLAADIDQARATRHLTAGACVEIAAQARVQRLLPFHFSRRYSRRVAEVRDELHRACRDAALAGKLVGLT